MGYQSSTLFPHQAARSAHSTLMPPWVVWVKPALDPFLKRGRVEHHRLSEPPFEADIEQTVTIRLKRIGHRRGSPRVGVGTPQGVR